MSATHLYRRACLIILPQYDYTNFIFDSELRKDPTLHTWVARKLHQKSNGDNPDAADDLWQICHRVVSKAAAERIESNLIGWSSSAKGKSIKNETLDTVASASLALAWPESFRDIASCSQGALSPSIIKELGGAIARDGLFEWRSA